MQLRNMAPAVLLLATLGACAATPEGAGGLPALSPRQAETEAYVRAIEAGMAHAAQLQEMRRSAARRQWVP